MGCNCHRPDRNCEKCHAGGVFTLNLSKDASKELHARKWEGRRIHCGDCPSLTNLSDPDPQYMSYCKKYKKELDYYDGPVKLDICYKKKYGEKK